MNEEIYEYYQQAGAIANSTIQHSRHLVKPGARILEVVETLEQMITDQDAEFAFPLNISLNEDAAHDTAGTGDDREFRTGDLVKVDMGVHVEGYIADTALTIDLGNNHLLVEASEAALDRAISMVRPGITAGELGVAIQKEIEERGYLPVSNLTGHGLDRYQLHGTPTIPNIGMQGGMELEEDMVFAIEPFATTGSGRVSESLRCEIYQQIAVKPVRLASARKVLESVRSRNGLPFARRWVSGKTSDIAIANLKKAQILRAYPVLHDIPGSMVSQCEHTLIVTQEGCTVTTA
ncbi:MAG: type II methionyl aminopeptidase [Methanomicrobiaceae archaeon]|nr:type II methionyl aminopeptidase [Methanomicrobiaceae archaeon]